MIPIGQTGGQQGEELIQTEAGLLCGGDRFQKRHNLGQIALATIGLAIRCPKQADLLVEANV